MLDLGTFLLLTLAALVGTYWWQSGVYKGRARECAVAHCRELGLQLLDQSMVIVGFWPVLERGRIAFRRRYQFEFSSIGDRRYQGRLVLVGMRLASIELDTYKLPGSE